MRLPCLPYRMPFGRHLAVAVLCFVAGLALNPSRAGAAGNSVTSPDTANIVGQSTSIALDGSIPVVSYYGNTNGDLKILRCGNSTCTSGNTITRPDTTGIVGQYTSLALDSQSRPVVAYFDSTNHALKILRCGNTTCSTGNSINTPDTDTVGVQTSLVLDGQGKPAVSYYAGHLKVLRCGNVTCSSGNTIADPDTDGHVGFHSAIAIAFGGIPVVSYYDQDNGDLKVLRCGDTTCTSGNSIATPDTGGDVGQYTSIVQGIGTGNSVVSYYDATNRNLKVLRCGNATCTSGNTFATPDTAGDVGTNTSLILDSSGNPVVSYRDETNGDLKVLHCGNSSCTANNFIAAVDTGGNVGFETSVALDAGTPVVSYFDQTNGDLKLLRCGDANCKGAANGDTDGDGCPDLREQQTAPGSQMSGGLRDYLNPWDYFNPTHDGLNRVDDVLSVVAQYFHDDTDANPGLPPYAPGYNVDTDRTALGPNVWNLGPPNGIERVDDVLAELVQYFHDCS
jgi:hypothetical protein